jgi:chaperonin GroES
MSKKKNLSVKPIGEKILVKRLEAEEKTKGGIYLPDTAKEKPKEGMVISVGEGRRLENGDRVAFQVKEGDKILFTSYAGTEIKIQGEEYLILGEEEVLGIIEE